MICASTSVVKDQKRGGLGSLKVFGRALARTFVRYEVVCDLLAFAEVGHACALDGGDVNKHVLGAVGGLNEAEAFCGVEEFNDTTVHADFLSIVRVRSRPIAGCGHHRV